MYHSDPVDAKTERNILIQINICIAFGYKSDVITIHEYVMTDDDKYFSKYTTAKYSLYLPLSRLWAHVKYKSIHA